MAATSAVGLWHLVSILSLVCFRDVLLVPVHQCIHSNDIRSLMRTKDLGNSTCLAWKAESCLTNFLSSDNSRGSDFLIFVERPFSWNKKSKEHLLLIIDRLHATVKEHEFHSRDSKFAVVQYSPKAKSSSRYFLVQPWTPHINSKELNRTLGVSEKKGKFSKVGLEQAFVLGTSQLLEDLVTKWIPKRFIPTNEVRGLEVLLDRDLHVIIFTGLQKSPKKSPKNDNHVNNFEPKMLKSLESILNNFIRDWNISFNLVVSQRYSLFVDMLGSPAASVLYGDGSHFNKALTLQKLIARGRQYQNTYQSHLLAKGIAFQVTDYTDLDSSCPLNPSSSGTEFIHYRHSDECLDISDGVVTSDGGCSFCSPIHGCVSDKERRSTSVVSMNPSRDTQQTSGNILLSGFTGSHADQDSNHLFLHSMDGSKIVDYVRELSVNEESLYSGSHCKGMPLQAVVKETTPVWEWQPTKPFFEPLMKFGEPVVLKNSVVTRWPAISKWSWSYLTDRFARQNLEAVKYTDSYLTFDPDLKAPLKVNISLPYAVKNMTAANFFSCVRFPHSCTDGYTGHYFFSSLPEELIPDTLPSDLLFHTQRDLDDRKQFIWISSPKMITHTHFDQDFNIFVQIKGRKRFTLWSPWQHELMYMYPRVHPMWHKSRINFQQPDLARFPLFGKSHASQVTVTPGDILFIPPYTWHYVETLDEPAVSISTWSHDYNLYDHMNTVYRHDHKFDLIASPEGGWACFMCMWVCAVWYCGLLGF